MNIADILPSLLTLLITLIGGIVAFTRQQASFENKIAMLEQQVNFEKEKSAGLKATVEHIAKGFESTKAEIAIMFGEIKNINTNIEYIKEAIIDIKERD